MKIEKISDTQIRVTLNHSDLQNRDIKIGELAYGSTKAQALFRDMMNKAYEDFGFEAENVPLMIEAVPLSTDSIMIVVTKVDDPNQIEERLEAIGERPTHRTFKESLENKLSDLQALSKEVPKSSSSTTHTLIYTFKNLEDVTHASCYIQHLYFGETTLYKYDNQYFMILKPNKHKKTNTEILKSMLSEFGEEGTSSDLNEIFLKEHAKVLIASNALDILVHYL